MSRLLNNPWEKVHILFGLRGYMMGSQRPTKYATQQARKDDVDNVLAVYLHVIYLPFVKSLYLLTLRYGGG